MLALIYHQIKVIFNLLYLTLKQCSFRITVFKEGFSVNLRGLKGSVSFCLREIREKNKGTGYFFVKFLFFLSIV